jgi:hypothetical protein
VKPEAPLPKRPKHAAEACLERLAVAGPSMEAVLERENLKKALAQVKRNKGAAGSERQIRSTTNFAAHFFAQPPRGMRRP